MAATSGPVEECRIAHSGDSVAHIGCLENALRLLGSEPQQPPSVNEPPARDVAPAVPLPEHNTGVAREKDDPIELEIVSTRYNARGLGTFQMSNGQVWRETTISPQYRRLEPDKVYTARIERGFLGGFRMHVTGIRRMLNVEQID